MVTEPRVPICLKAMLVGNIAPDKKYSICSADYRNWNYALGTEVQTNPLSYKESMPKGIHLHWNLPPSMTRGAENSEGTIEFPSVPAKWILTRLWSDNSYEKIHTVSFVIESDALQTSENASNGNVGSATTPYINESNKNYYFLGRSYRSYAIQKPLSQNVKRLDKLMAVSYGNPAFGAFYPDCVNVFGFYDSMKDINGNPLQPSVLCYTVCGCNDDGSICHGRVDNIFWEGADKNYPTGIPKDTGNIKIAVGNNSAEALSVLISLSGKKKEYAERMLNHMLNRNSQTILNPNGILLSEYSLKESQFAFHTGGKFFTIKRMDSVGADKEPPQNTAEAVALINRWLKEIRAAEHALRNSQEKIYDMWYEYMQANKIISQSIVSSKIPQGIKDIAAKQPNKIKDAEQDIRSEMLYLNQKKQLLNSKITSISEILKPDFYLNEQEYQRFFEPNEPVVLITGGGRDKVREFFNSIDTTVKNSADTISVTVKQLNEKYTINASELTDIIETNDANINAFISETALLSGSFSENIAVLALKKSGNPLTQTNINAVKQSVKDTQKNILKDSVAFLEYLPPWFPLFIDWEAVYYPDSALMRESPSLENWKWNNGDYIYKGKPILSENGVTFQGRAILTPHVAAMLSNASIEAFGESNGAETIDVISQFFNGFNEKFNMREIRLQMPVLDFQKNGNPELAALVKEAIEGFDREHPVFNSFYSPLRGGYYEIKKIQIIDTFGQILEITPFGVLAAEAFRDNEEIFRKTIMLPPRISMPSRIRFDWDNAYGSPIKGWLLPNLLERHIAVYDTNGEHLGNIQKISLDGGGVVWKDPPFKGGGTSDIPQSMNRDLYLFTSHIINEWKKSKNDLLTPLLDVINESLWRINPASAALYNGLGLFLHRPLVLAKAGICIELMEKQKEYKYSITGDIRAAQKTTPTLNKVQFPVFIGSESNHNDGVIGFFADGKYSKLHVCGGSKEDDYFTKSNYMSLTPDFDNTSRDISILMDPIGEVSIESGILPVKLTKIGNELLESALKKLRYSIMCTPILTDPSDIHIPHLEIDGKRWSFMYNLYGDWKDVESLTQTNDTAVHGKNAPHAIEGWLGLEV